MVTLDKKQEVVRLRAMEYSFDKIAFSLDLSKPTVVDICTEQESEIEAMRQMQKHTMCEELMYTTQERSKLYRELIGKVHAEILSRDIKGISTEKLFTVLERLERSLSNLEPKATYGNDPFAEFDDISDADLEKIAKVSVTLAK